MLPDLIIFVPGHVSRINCSGVWYAAMPQEQWPTDREYLHSLESSWDELYGDRGNELVFIGQNLDREKTIGRLKECLVTNEEDLGGVPVWDKFSDPLPVW